MQVQKNLLWCPGYSTGSACRQAIRIAADRVVFLARNRGILPRDGKGPGLMRDSLQQALETWRTCLALGALVAEAQSVIAYRSFGMLGGWSLAGDENQRMVAEKPAAFLEANLAAATALLAGQQANQVTLAWIQPLSDVVGSNRARLESRGPAGPAALFRHTAG